MCVVMNQTTFKKVHPNTWCQSAEQLVQESYWQQFHLKKKINEGK
jgi:hypothetical protein